MSKEEKGQEILVKNKQKNKLNDLLMKNKQTQSNFGKTNSQNTYQKGQKSLKRYIKHK